MITLWIGFLLGHVITIILHEQDEIGAIIMAGISAAGFLTGCYFLGRGLLPYFGSIL